MLAVAAELVLVAQRLLSFEIEVAAAVQMLVALNWPHLVWFRTRHSIRNRPDCQCRSDNIES